MGTHANNLIWILSFLFFLTGCRDQPAEPSPPVRKLKICRRLVEDSAVVMLTLKKGMNDYELEVLEQERGQGLQACLRRHPDLPGRCLDLASRKSIQDSIELATTFCMTWPDDLVDCLQKQDLDSPGCRRALEKFRGRVNKD